MTGAALTLFWGVLKNDRQYWCRLRLGTVLTQPPKHVLDPHERIVKKLANSNGETAKGHGVDAEAKRMKHDNGDEDRDRDGRERNRGCSPVEQEQKQDGRTEKT